MSHARYWLREVNARRNRIEAIRETQNCTPAATVTERYSVQGLVDAAPLRENL